MSDYSADLHEAYIKISTWYQDPNFIYSMNEDEVLNAYDYTYSVLRRFIENHSLDKNLSEDALAERNAIEEMTPVVADRINYGLAYCLFEPEDKEDEENISKMEQPDKQIFKNASFVLAGGACLLMIAYHFLFSEIGVLPIRGSRLLAALGTPTLCFWAGMFVRHLCGKVKWWVLAVAAVLAAVSFYFSRHTVNNLGWSEIRFLWYFLILAGFLLPQDYLYDRRDKEGIKSFMLLVITALFYGAFELFWGRVYPFCMKPQFEDMAVLLMVVTTNMLPLAALLPVFFAAEFSLSNPAQWLGGQKWFRWIVGIAGAFCFLGAISRLFDYSPLFYFSTNNLIQFFVQPFTIYLIIVICRIIRKLRKKEMTWKEVFNL